MLETGSDGAEVDIPDVTGHSLLNLRQTMDQGKPSGHFELDGPLLELCVRYDMYSLGYAIMRATSPPAQRKDAAKRSAHFKWSSRFDCIESVIELLLNIDHEDLLNSDMPGLAGFSRSFAADLRPEWVYAITRAERET